ncbi:hypothetical protein [Nostoc sp. NMS8]|uniref:hypothetical protein n=1 Tax=Nostoc sp. NMS8 TaxID=2815392 RepID=UPI00260034E7|nr:hypothetical protein [Nostoc sp. NMS8]MBN3961762.1 hypothetical protein [Nostoc sp. NMS8]
MNKTQTTQIDLENSVSKNTTYTEQSAESTNSILYPGIQQQLSMGGIAIGTMVCLALLLREIRLLVEACKS